MDLQQIHLSIQSHPEKLAQIREAVSNELSKAKIAKDVAGSIILAIDEACSNIIRHSYENDHTREIDISLEITPTQLTITIKDQGIKFDISQVEPRDVTVIKPGGLGIYIIQQVMDEVTYSRTPDGYNQLTLVKKR